MNGPSRLCNISFFAHPNTVKDILRGEGKGVNPGANVTHIRWPLCFLEDFAALFALLVATDLVVLGFFTEGTALRKKRKQNSSTFKKDNLHLSHLALHHH